MKDWYIYELEEKLQVAESIEEVYNAFVEKVGIDTDTELSDDLFGVIKIQSTTKPKLQHIKVTRTLKLV